MTCPAPSTGSGFLQGSLQHLDCQAQTLGSVGYQALAGPASPLAPALSVLLALFIAWIGFRYLTGRALSINEWLTGAIKIGMVLMLATSWPAYRMIVHDLVLKGPAEIAGSIGSASQLPGSNGGLAARLDAVDTGIMSLVEAGSGRLDIASRRPTGASESPVSDAVALGYAKTIYIGSILGGFGLLRLAGGLFLALAPLFAGFLLFEGTRFLFMGWLRALIAVAIASIGLAIVHGVQLAILEPWLTQVLGLRAARIATLSAPFELLALTLAFALATLGVIALAVRIAFSSSIVARIETAVQHAISDTQYRPSGWRPDQQARHDPMEEQSRARMLAQSIVHMSNRESRSWDGSTAGQLALRQAIEPTHRGADNGPAPTIPLGRTYGSATRRVSAQTLQRRPGS